MQVYALPVLSATPANRQCARGLAVGGVTVVRTAVHRRKLGSRPSVRSRAVLLQALPRQIARVGQLATVAIMPKNGSGDFDLDEFGDVVGHATPTGLVPFDPTVLGGRSRNSATRLKG